jgi:hypothetical protein
VALQRAQIQPATTSLHLHSADRLHTPPRLR